ncbi:MAG: carboxypeptidase regulatory-like domain-containing protein [Deltaproteobacteria bacterium]
MNIHQTNSPMAMPPHETSRRCAAGTSGWALAGLGVAAATLIGTFSAVEKARAKEPVQVSLRPDTTAVLAAAAVGADSKSGTGTLKGVVTFKGTPPKRELEFAKGDKVKVKEADRAICAGEDYYKDHLIVSDKGNGVANVFVYLPKAPAGYKAPPVPSDPVVFDQKGCRFIPHALVVRCKQKILIKSDDDLVHNTHTNPVRNTKGFNQAIKPKEREGVETSYDKPENVPVKVNCDLHPWMTAWHLPLDHPFMAVTDAEGKFEIKGLPPGKYEFRVWHEMPGYLEKKLAVEIKADKDTVEKLSFTAAQFKVGS